MSKRNRECETEGGEKGEIEIERRVHWHKNRHRKVTDKNKTYLNLLNILTDNNLLKYLTSSADVCSYICGMAEPGLLAIHRLYLITSELISDALCE